MNELGKDGEETATAYLRKKGYVILETNYRTPLGEIDIIAKDRDTVVFVEVKTRSAQKFGQPFEAVGPRKRDTMKKVALMFLKRLKQEPAARFDILSITVQGGGQRVEHITDAFEM